MAISKKRRAELLAQYVELLKKSEALVLTTYTGASVKGLETLRNKVRGAQGEYHVVKNSLAAIALKQLDMPVADDMLTGSSGVGFAFSDAAGVAKAINEFAKDSEFVKVKGAIMDGKVLSVKEVEALANLPPLPVVRAQLLGLLNTPATRVAGTLASGVRQLVNVTKAYADKDGSAEPAPAA